MLKKKSIIGLFSSVAVLAILGAASCSSSTSLSLDPEPGGGLTDLPDLRYIDSPPLRETSYIDFPDLKIEGEDYFTASSDATIDGSDVILTAPHDGISYAVFQMGGADHPEEGFFYTDQVISITVDAASAGGDPEDFGYYVAVSYFRSDIWRHSAKQTQEGEVDIASPANKGCVSPGQSVYIAVIVYDGVSIELEEVTGHFLLTGRELDHLDPLLPPGELANLDVRLDFNAVDANGFAVYSFNGMAAIESNPPGMIVLEDPEFSEGYGEALVRFPSVGEYELILSNSSPMLNGSMGTILIYETQLPVYSLHIASADLKALWSDIWAEDYYPVEFSIDGVDFVGAQGRFRGGSSREFIKKSWKVRFDQAQQYDDPDWGYTRKTLNLNAEYIDASLMRSKLSYDLMEDMEILAPRCRFVHFRINDQFQGLYVDVENPRTDWLESYGMNPDGSFYEAKHNNMSELPTPADYEGYAFEKELREDEPYDDLAAFIHALNSWPGRFVYDELTQWLDTDRYADYLAMNALTAQSDALTKNYSLYYDEFGSGKWIVVPWDYDLTWGRMWSPTLGLFDPVVHYTLPLDYANIEAYGYGNILVTRYVNDPQFWDEYAAALTSALNTHFGETQMINRIDSYLALVGPDAHADRQRWTPGDHAYEFYVEELREYVRQRRAFIAFELGL